MKGLCGVLALALLTAVGCASAGDEPPWHHGGLIQSLTGPSSSAKADNLGGTDLPQTPQSPTPAVR